MQGANRLASNSLLEALLYFNQIFNFLSVQEFTKHNVARIEQKSVIKSYRNFINEVQIVNRILTQLKMMMRTKVGIIGNIDNLYVAKIQLKNWQDDLNFLENKESICYFELRNMLLVA